MATHQPAPYASATAAMVTPLVAIMSSIQLPRRSRKVTVTYRGCTLNRSSDDVVGDFTIRTILRLPTDSFRILKRPSNLEMVEPFQDVRQTRTISKLPWAISRLPRTISKLHGAVSSFCASTCDSTLSDISSYIQCFPR